MTVESDSYGYSSSSSSGTTYYIYIGSSYSTSNGHASKTLDFSTSGYPAARYAKISLEYIGSCSA